MNTVYLDNIFISFSWKFLHWNHKFRYNWSVGSEIWGWSILKLDQVSFRYSQYSQFYLRADQHYKVDTFNGQFLEMREHGWCCQTYYAEEFYAVFLPTLLHKPLGWDYIGRFFRSRCCTVSQFFEVLLKIFTVIRSSPGDFLKFSLVAIFSRTWLSLIFVEVWSYFNVMFPALWVKSRTSDCIDLLKWSTWLAKTKQK